MSFNILHFFQLVNAANAAVYGCDQTPTELNIQTALISISSLYTYVTSNTPAAYNNFTEAQYQNLVAYLNMTIRRNGPAIVLNNASSIGALANNYSTQPIATTGYFFQTACTDFASTSTDPSYSSTCNPTGNPATCDFASALSVFSTAYKDMCNTNIKAALNALSTTLSIYNSGPTTNHLTDLANAIIAYNSAANSATDGYLVVLNTYITTPITAGNTNTLLSLSQAVATNPNGLQFALFLLGEQNLNGGSFAVMIKNSVNNEYHDAGHCSDCVIGNCWYQDTSPGGWYLISGFPCSRCK